MLKFSPLLGITAICLAVVACQPSDPSSSKSGIANKNAPTGQPAEQAEVNSRAPIGLILPVVDVDNLPDALIQADAAFVSGRYEDNRKNQPAALEWYLAILKLQPDNKFAQAGLEKTLSALSQTSIEMLRTGNLAEAERLIHLLKLAPTSTLELASLDEGLMKAKRADVWQKKAVALERKGIILPSQAKDNAVAAYQEALRMYPGYQPAIMAIDRLRTSRENKALNLAQRSNFAAAFVALNQAKLIDGGNPQFRTVANHIEGLLTQSIQRPIVLARLALDSLNLESARKYYLQAQKIFPLQADVIALAQRLDDVEHYGRYKPHQTFSDAWVFNSPAPDMVVIPYGKFDMGAHPTAESAAVTELPRHEVIFKRGFAMAKSEITVAQFRQFIESTGYRTSASKQGGSIVFNEKGGSMTNLDNIDWRHDHLGRLAKDDLPVVHVDLSDAEAYAAWLSKKTGLQYQIPSEAQFEYVLGEGKDTIYPWGNQAPKKVIANLAGAGDKSTLSRSWGNAIAGYRDFYWGAAPVRSFQPAAWGVFDMSGNVEEWVQDCWHESYQRAPGDGSAWRNPGCTVGVTRGASWASSLDEARVSFRMTTSMQMHNARIGFRVVRSL